MNLSDLYRQRKKKTRLKFWNGYSWEPISINEYKKAQGIPENKNVKVWNGDRWITMI